MKNIEFEKMINSCPECKGTGFIFDNFSLPRTCSRCKGTGTNPYGYISFGTSLVDYIYAIFLGIAIGGIGGGFLGNWLWGENGVKIGAIILSIICAVLFFLLLHWWDKKNYK